MKAGLWNPQKTRNPDFTPIILSFFWPKDDTTAPKGSNKGGKFCFLSPKWSNKEGKFCFFSPKWSNNEGRFCFFYVKWSKLESPFSHF